MTYSDVSRKKPELIFRDEVRPLRFRWDLTLFPAAAGGGPPGVRSVDMTEETVSSQRIRINSRLQLPRTDLWRSSVTYLKHLVVFLLNTSPFAFVQGVIFPTPPPPQPPPK